MKPKKRLETLEKQSFRPDDQPGLFSAGGPVVVLLSDVQEHVGALVEEIKTLERRLTQLSKQTGASRKPNSKGRGFKHRFPEPLEVEEEARIRKLCEHYGADFKLVVYAARLYSEQGDVKYNSWPAAIEIAFAGDYAWIRPARTGKRRAATVGDHQPTEKQLAARRRVEEARRAQTRAEPPPVDPDQGPRR